jgi:flagellin
MLRLLNEHLPKMVLRNFHQTGLQLHKNIEKMVTGRRINRAADDTGAFAVPEGTMTPRINAFAQSSKNTQDAVSYLHSAEGGMQMIDASLQRLRTLATQAATETYTSEDRAKIQLEIDQLLEEIDRIASSTEFNGRQPLTGEILDIHIGASGDETLAITVTSVTVTALGLSGLTVTGSSNTNAEQAITSLDAALSIKLGSEVLVGSEENRLSNVLRGLSIMKEGESRAVSRIRDLDYAGEMMALTRNKILYETGLLMIRQLNLSRQAVSALIE